MKFYYDVLVNVNEELYDFYEWSKSDGIEHVKSLPIIRVDSSKIGQIYNNKIKINETLCKRIVGQVTGYNENLMLHNAVLFTDMYSSLIVEFNDAGEEIGISKLVLEDDLNVIEIAFSLELEDIELFSLCPREKKMLRQDARIKRVLEIEYKYLYDKGNYEKLSYLYYERFGKEGKTLEGCFERLMTDLNNIKSIHYDLFDLVALTYKKSALCA